MADNEKKVFIRKYGFLYSLCLCLSLGLGFLLAVVMNGGGDLWNIAVYAIPGILVVSFAVGFGLAGGIYKHNYGLRKAAGDDGTRGAKK